MWNEEVKNKIAEILQSVIDSLPAEKLDGRETLIKMREKDLQYRQLEYFAFFVEHLVNSVLGTEYFEPKKFKHETCIIDSFFKGINGNSGFPVDIKLHDTTKKSIQINDKETMDKSFETYNMFGLIVVNAKFEKDDGTLRTFQKELGGDKSKYINVSGNHRKIKSSCLILSIDFYALRNSDQLKIHKQGRNSNGEPRPPKYEFDTSKIKSEIHIERNTFL